MKHTLGASIAALSLAVSSPAMAATFIDAGNSAFVTFDGTQPATSANLLLTLLSKNTALNTFTFSYTLNNTSNAALNPNVRLSSFGFNDTVGSTPTGSATGDFDNISFGSNFPNGLGSLEVCVSDANCQGGNGGALVGDPAIGSFTLDYTGTGLTQITLNDFAVRYISTGARGNGSGTGVGIQGEIPGQTAAVPEPATWAMMLLGFGFVGGAMRSAKRRQKLTVSNA
jgi:hypothetical protein